MLRKRRAPLPQSSSPLFAAAIGGSDPALCGALWAEFYVRFGISVRMTRRTRSFSGESPVLQHQRWPFIRASWCCPPSSIARVASAWPGCCAASSIRWMRTQRRSAGCFNPRRIWAVPRPSSSPRHGTARLGAARTIRSVRSDHVCPPATRPRSRAPPAGTPASDLDRRYDAGEGSAQRSHGPPEYPLVIRSCADAEGCYRKLTTCSPSPNRWSGVHLVLIRALSTSITAADEKGSPRPAAGLSAVSGGCGRLACGSLGILGSTVPA